MSAAFQTRQTQQQLAFIPFVTAGDPDLSVTCDLIRELSAAGADLIEVGFPYSDPIADGPVIQSSYTRALNHKVKLDDIFAAVAKVSREIPTPLLAMVSYAIIFRSGSERFVQRAVEAGFCGLIVPDLPGDEAAEFAQLTSQAGLALVQLVAPTTPAVRLERILKQASGFVYCIAVAGTTGVKEALPSDLTQMLGQLRKQTKLPLAVGFGVSRPEQVRGLKGLADGAIVGSALVKFLTPKEGETLDLPTAKQDVKQLANDLATAAHG
ncbi:tryptophan synthase subunit alpha [bacterium]|nr:tryptophan synthase subunit alpha [bacterium]